MLAIARALIRDPKIVLLDEPFEGLAPILVHELLATCRTLAEAGQTILVVEQNISAAMSLADRAYIINNGHIVEALDAAADARPARPAPPPSRRLEQIPKWCNHFLPSEAGEVSASYADSAPSQALGGHEHRWWCS